MALILRFTREQTKLFEFLSLLIFQPTSLHLRHSSFSNTSVALPTSQLILQSIRCFTYVTGHSPTLLSLSYVTGSSLTSPGKPPTMTTGPADNCWRTTGDPRTTVWVPLLYVFCEHPKTQNSVNYKN